MTARTDTKPTAQGNYVTAVTCSNNHTTYKNYLASSGDLYKCGQVTNPATGAKCGQPV